MKKTFLTTILLLTVFLVNAQISFGIKAGYNSSLTTGNLKSVSSGDYDVNSVKVELANNFQGGLFLRNDINNFYIQPELLYTLGHKGYDISFQNKVNDEVTFSKSLTISTIDIPVLIGYKLISFEKYGNLRIFAGPKLRLDMGSSMNFENISSSADHDNLTEDITVAKLGLEAGVGVDIALFTLDARYNLIGDIYQAKLNDLTISRIPANTFVISLGWKIF